MPTRTGAAAATAAAAAAAAAAFYSERLRRFPRDGFRQDGAPGFRPPLITPKQGSEALLRCGAR